MSFKVSPDDGKNHTYLATWRWGDSFNSWVGDDLKQLVETAVNYCPKGVREKMREKVFAGTGLGGSFATIDYSQPFTVDGVSLAFGLVEVVE